jgi:hypothetical protein
VRVLGLTEIVTGTALELLEGKFSELDQTTSHVPPRKLIMRWDEGMQGMVILSVRSGISWLVWCCTPRLRGPLPPQCPIMVGNLVIDGTAKQRNTKGTVPCSLEKKSLTIVDRGDCSERFGGSSSGSESRKK